jgi:hypothetical protein
MSDGGRGFPMRRVLAMLVCGAAWSALAQGGGLAPAYSRGGFDYFSAPVDAPTVKKVPNACERDFGANVEVHDEGEKGYQCSIITASEPRLSAKLKEELDLIDVPEPRRQRLVDAVIDKYKRLAQCPAGTAAYYDGSMYLCGKRYAARALCAAGSPVVQDSGQVSCAVASCPASKTDLGALTGGKHLGCFKCPAGSYDATETEAFHGALTGRPAEFTEGCGKVGPPPAPGK